MLKNYLKIFLRRFRHHLGFSLINVLGLATGMACCILIMLYVGDELSYDTDHAQADRIYRLVVEADMGGRHLSTALTPPPWGPTLHKDFPEVLDVVRMKTPNSRWLIKYEDKEFWERGFYFVDESIFDVFSFTFLQGNPATALSEPNTVVITESVARKYFGDEDPMGKVLNGEDFILPRVTGVVEDFDGNSHFRGDFFTSMRTLAPHPDIVSLYGNLYDGDWRSQGMNFAVYTYLLLQNGQAAHELEEKLPAFLDTYLGPALRGRGAEVQPYLQPLESIHLHSNLDNEIQANGTISTIYTFSVLALIIILIACINFMNLSTAQSARRAREVGMRKVAGADRSQLIKQFIAESMVLAVIAMILALLIVHVVLPSFNELAGKELAMEYSRVSVLVALLGTTLLVGLLSGSYPAFFLSSFRPVTVLKGVLRTGSGSSRLRQGLVVLQFAMAVSMMVATYVVYNQLNFLQEKNLGFEKEHLVNITLANINMANGYQTYEAAILDHPDILGASGSSSLPGGQLGIVNVRAAGAAPDDNVTLNVIAADFGFAETLGIEMSSGRYLSSDFASDSSTAVVVNETAARMLGWENPADQQLVVVGSFPPRMLDVVGVAKDFHYKSLHQRIEPMLLYFGTPGPLWYGSVRISGNNVQETIEFMEQKWAEIFPQFPFEYSFLDQDFDNQYRAEEQLQQVFSAFAVLAVIITCLGLFAFASFTAEQRTKEVSVRKVMGASVGSLVMLLTQDFTKLVLFAIIPGALVAYFSMNRWLHGFAYSIEIDLIPFLLAGSAALVITVLTVGYQSVKAALANPVDALQYE